MEKAHLTHSEQEKVDYLVEQIKNLHADINFFKSCPNLTSVQRIENISCIMKKENLKQKLLSLLDGLKYIPEYVRAALR